ncbi:MAG: hypothetical protein ACP5O3_03180 [Candidatus Micrarchaeia archaeon]
MSDKVLLVLALFAALLLLGCTQQAPQSPSPSQAQATAATALTPSPSTENIPFSSPSVTPAATAKPSLQPGDAFIPETTATPTPTPVPTPTPSPTPERQVFYINASQWQFTPDRITVKAGTPVRFIVQALDNGSGQGHGIAIDNPEWGFRRILVGPDFNPATGKKDKYYPVTIDFTPTTPGTYTYYTQVNTGSGTPQEKGTLVVTP